MRNDLDRKLFRVRQSRLTGALYINVLRVRAL